MCPDLDADGVKDAEDGGAARAQKVRLDGAVVVVIARTADALRIEQELTREDVAHALHVAATTKSAIGEQTEDKGCKGSRNHCMGGG